MLPLLSWHWHPVSRHKYHSAICTWTQESVGYERCLWILQENPVGFLEPWLPLFTILARNYQEWSPYKLQIKLEQWWMPPLPSPICSMALNLLNIYPKHAKQRLSHCYKGLSHCFSTKFNSSREASHYVQLCWFHFFPYAGFSLS